MITSIRPIIVDYLKTIDSVKSLVGDNVTDIDYNFEDLYGAQANALSFPAISIEAVSLDPEYSTNCIDMNQYSESLNLSLYQQVVTSRLRSKNANVKAEETEKLRILDTLKEAVLNNLNALRGDMNYKANILMVRILSSTNSVFNTDNKSKIYQTQISINITYNKGAL
jgi:hypothetical protein